MFGQFSHARTETTCLKLITTNIMIADVNLNIR